MLNTFVKSRFVSGKKLLMFVVTITTLTAKSQTSFYYPFPEDSATWCSSMCGLQGNAYFDATDKLTGKILINGNWYSRMLHYGRSCYGAGMCYCAALNGADTTTQYIRQDTAQKKVWIYIASTNSDTIFLDFNLNVGDTLDGRNEYWAEILGLGNFAIVDSIDSVLIGTQYRIRYNYSYQGYPNSMIEGIGPTHGFFNGANQGFDYLTALNLFTQYNQIFYPYYSADTIGMGQLCHDFTTGIEEPNLIPYNIYPNPATTEIRISSRYLSGGFRICTIDMYDVFGERVLQTSNFNLLTASFDFTSLRSGIYFITITDDAGNKTVKKVVKM